MSFPARSSERKPRRKLTRHPRTRQSKRAFLFESLEERLNLSLMFMEIEQNDVPYVGGEPFSDHLDAAQEVVHPGDFASLAPGVVPGVVDSLTMAVATENDSDIYTFTAVVDGEVSIAVINQGGDPSGDGGADRLDIRVYDATATGISTSQAIGQSTPGGSLLGLKNVLLPTERYTESFSATAGERFFVRVASDAGDDDSEYELRIWTSETSDSGGGNNNTQSNAAALGTVDGTTALTTFGTITQPDRDFIEFAANANGEVSVRITMPEGTGYPFGPNGDEPTNLGIRVWNNSGQIIATSNGTAGNVDVASFNAIAGPTYYAEVYSGSFGQVNAYDLDISFVGFPEGRITGYVFQDDNLDTFKEPIENFLNNFDVSIDIDNDGATTADVTFSTGADGFYSFESVPFGTHRVYITPQPGFYTVYPEFDYVIQVGEDNLNMDHIDFAMGEADFGDAPFSYLTSLTSDGARHSARGPMLGAERDAESDASTPLDGTGDDATGTADDEDGVTFPNPLLVGATINISVNSSAGGGKLDFFFDWDRDGVFGNNVNEVYSTTLSGGPATVSVAVPPGATPGNSFARFRISTLGALGPAGPAEDGEVEDYAITIVSNSSNTLTVNIVAATISEGAGPAATTGTVTRGGDLTTALVVNLSSSDESEATVQSAVTIAAGQASSPPFDIDAIDDSLADGTQTVTITASATGYPDGSDSVDVTDDDSITLTVNIAAAAISENAGATTGTVTRNGDLTNSLMVNLSSNDLTEATVQSTVTIAAGQAISPPFDINAEDDAILDGTQTVTITASAAGYPDGTDTVDVTDDDNIQISGKKTNALGQPLAGFKFELFSEAAVPGIFNPASPFDAAPSGVDTFVQTAVTDATGTYNFGRALTAGTYYIREVPSAGWYQTLPAPPTDYITVIDYSGGMVNVDTAPPAVATPNGPFVNDRCFDNFFETSANLGQTITATRAGLLTIEVIGNADVSFQVDSSSPVAGLTPSLAKVTALSFTSRSSGTNRARVDLVLTAGDVGKTFTITPIQNVGATPTLLVANSIFVDTASKLIIQGGICSDSIFVRDDPAAGGSTSDAKSIFVGSYAGSLADFDNGADLTGQFNGVKYNAAIINASYNNPTIASVQIFGGSGNDIIRVGPEIIQALSLDGGAGDDVIRAGGGRATIHGRTGTDFIVGGRADDILYGNDGNDYIHGLAGSEHIFGGNGNDLLSGGEGNDLLIRGQNGDDMLSGGIGVDRLIGDAGIDTGYREVTGTGAAVDIFVSVDSQIDVPTAPTGPLTGDLAELEILALIDRFWADGNADGPDTLDEIIAQLLP